MSGTIELLEAQPTPPEPGAIKVLANFIDAVQVCAQACTSCAASCMAEDDPGPMAACVAACLDCADVCSAAARIVSRPLSATRREAVAALVQACAGMCELTARECFRHEMHHRHCRLCMAACRACLDACESLLEAL
jgi:hypothetical protein